MQIKFMKIQRGTITALKKLEQSLKEFNRKKKTSMDASIECAKVE